MGLEVVSVGEGEKSLEALRQEEFDVFVADLYLPCFDGLQLIRIAQRIDPDLQAIVLTGSASLKTAVEALRAGVYDYLTKPMESLAVFEMALSRALERRKLIKENKQLFAEVQRLAITDPLTGLYNRHKLNDALHYEVERAQRYGRPLSIILFDLDNLKFFNDTYGHSAGDEVLKVVAGAIREQVREIDLPARIGGDEFLIVLPEANQKTGYGVAKRICEQIHSTEVLDERIAVSAGIGQWSPDFVSPERFIHAVDQTMYTAKRAGGKRIAICESGPDIEFAQDEKILKADPLTEKNSVVAEKKTANRD
jgi:diguanylate cyclase (GGDEF)-like protein